MLCAGVFEQRAVIEDCHVELVAESSFQFTRVSGSVCVRVRSEARYRSWKYISFMTGRTCPCRATVESILLPFHVAASAQVMKHGFDFLGDLGISLVACNAEPVAGVIGKIMVACQTADFCVVLVRR